jgi:D-methionine transport system ATP-binding protein
VEGKHLATEFCPLLGKNEAGETTLNVMEVSVLTYQRDLVTEDDSPIDENDVEEKNVVKAKDHYYLLQTISKERGITVIIITHDMSVIEQICHRVAILDAGCVAEIGEVETVFSNPKSKAGRRLVSPMKALPESDWDCPVARVAFNGSMTEEPVIATLAMEKQIAVSILGADTRNVDGKTFGTLLISLPEEVEKRRVVLDYLNAHQGVTAEEVR